MVRLETVRQVERLLQEHAVAPAGLTVADLRRLYPAREVRRRAIVDSLRHLEDHALVTWHEDHVHWRGPVKGDVRPFGTVDVARLARDLAHSPQERVRIMAELSDALVRPRG